MSSDDVRSKVSYNKRSNYWPARKITISTLHSTSSFVDFQKPVIVIFTAKTVP